MKGNFHKKITKEDKFARKYYCKHARLNQLRADKQRQKRVMRAYNNGLIRGEQYEEERLYREDFKGEQ